jgi:hypothetical protein
MPRTQAPARIHLIAAKEAPIAVILRRKPTRTWHVLKWNLLTDELTPGSWFRGRLYPMRSDLSWDGRLMSYFAMGREGDTWTGISEVPSLKTVVHWANTSTFNGGAVWLRPDIIYRNLIWMDQVEPFPDATPEEREYWAGLNRNPEFRQSLERRRVQWSSKQWQSKLSLRPLHTGTAEDFSILFHRLHRDGWRPAIAGKPGPDVFGPEGQWISQTKFRTTVESDGGWIWRPTARHPVLRVRYVGHLSGSVPNYGEVNKHPDLRIDPNLVAARTGYILLFDLPEFPAVLGPQVDWATWTNTGDLIYALRGSVFRHTLKTLRGEKAPKRLDLESFEQPLGRPLPQSNFAARASWA